MTITHHCSECGNQVDEFCAEHPGATVESIQSGITRGQILRLQQEAGEAGDTLQVEICDRALAGDSDATAECERVIAEAHSDGKATSPDYD